MVAGYKLHNGLVAHKNMQDPKRWVVTDYASGLFVKNHLETLKECIQYAKNFPDKEKAEEVKKSEKYIEYVKMIDDWKKNYFGEE